VGQIDFARTALRVVAIGVLGLAIFCGESEPARAAAIELPTGDYLLNLYDAFGPDVPGTVQDFGFAALIRYRDKLILFDSGTNAEILKKNTEALGVDLREIDFAIASHSHFDHISGFDHVLKVNPKLKIYFPPDPFWGAPLDFDATGRDADAKDALPMEQRYFAGKKTRFTFRSSGRFWKANVEFVKEHVEIEPGINLILTRSPFLGYFSRYPRLGAAAIFKNAASDDSKTKLLQLPELSLCLSTPQGEVVVAGCSHSLVHVITKTAKEHLGQPIAMVAGGFHLLPYGRKEIDEIAANMRDELGVKFVAPAHCTGHLGFQVFREVFGENYRLAGLGTATPFPR
jgi:7,8-dihydropterin-6-yl-methyl-4-(beta-D-ribofuranosyl)aminobenzene 5'-phosphate synthase